MKTCLTLPDEALAELKELCRFFLIRKPGSLVAQDVKPVIEAFIRKGDVRCRSAVFGMTLLHFACQLLLPVWFMVRASLGCGKFIAFLNAVVAAHFRRPVLPRYALALRRASW